MDKIVHKNPILRKLKYISTIISWSVFAILIVCCMFLLYYFFAIKYYEKKGAGYEPLVSLFTIVSPSMVPNINVYDVVFETKINKPEDIKIGDVISYNSSNFIAGRTISITHRVIEIINDENGNYFFTTKGDNNPVSDSQRVPFTSITGKVQFKIPQLGRIQFFLASKAGYFLVIILPAMFIIIKDIFKIIKRLVPIANKKYENNILFLPIVKKQLYLPFKGVTDGKFNFNNLIPFEFDRNVAKTNISDKNVSNEELNDIYNDLLEIENLKGRD